MEEDDGSALVLDGCIKSITLSIATDKEICTYSVNECPISHPSQLGNPFLGLPLEFGKCESCGTAEHGKCEGHFGFIELPVPVFHPAHVSELRQILSLVCLKCLRLKKGKVKNGTGNESNSSTSCYYCRDLPPIAVKEGKTTDGAIYLELRVSSRKNLRPGFWNFLNRYGFLYGEGTSRPLLPHEALNILREIPEETRKKLAGKGFFPQTGYIMQHLPVPPNCLHVPEINDGRSIISYDVSHMLLKKVLSKIELIKRSRSGTPNFESHEVESNDLQVSIAQYMHLRGTTRGPQDTKRYAIGSAEPSQQSTKQWLEKMKTLFISKGSGFSSRSVITGDPYIGINVIGLPSEIARRITFEERVTHHNMARLQEVVDKRLCVTYRDGNSTYAISVGSKGYTSLKVGQVVNRSIIDGDLVFVNRPPSTHKHSLQAFYVYVHDDHTVKINPLICSPLGADFDGDCIHIFYPQSLSAKAEALELFSVEKQLTSSHSGNLNLQLAHDSLLGLKLLYKNSFLKKETAQQLAMNTCSVIAPPAVVKSDRAPLCTVTQLIQSALPEKFSSCGERHTIVEGEITKLDLDRDSVHSSFSEIVSSVFCNVGPGEALNIINVLQPLMMEILLLEGFSVSLLDFDVPRALLRSVRSSIQRQSYILANAGSTLNQSADLRVESYLKHAKNSVKNSMVDFIVRSSGMGWLIDAKSDSSVMKVVQQLGFLGLQLYRQGRFYSTGLVEDCLSAFANRFSCNSDENQSRAEHPSEAYGLVKSSFYHGLNPYEGLVHSISTREVIVRSSRGLTEPGTLFKNLMAVLRDVVICYDGSVRNICSNSVIQFEYGDRSRDERLANRESPPGEPVGVLAATAISNPAYKAVLDSSQSNNTSWELMKEILLTRTLYKGDVKDRRVILFLNDCFCGKKFCKERAAIAVQSCLKKIKLEDCATEFFIESQKQSLTDEAVEATECLVGHIHLDKGQLELLDKSLDDILHKCEDSISKNKKKKGPLGLLLRKITLSSCECCGQENSDGEKVSRGPCLQFSLSDENASPSCESFEQLVRALANHICPILLDTIIKGDPRVREAKIIWVGAEEISWVRNSKQTLHGEVAVEMVIEKEAAQMSGDSWRTAMDACIPVISLIDTRRSIPYGVQQIKEVLGISCAFDQVVQRLNTGIKAVAKGVLTDHLIVVANSMTCTGNLNGFNSSGYKSMFRSLKVQVPFTEATLYTPMKCFDKAAEKCHVDSLASAVSSCSWGKHVALGTGSAFQILWDKNKLEKDKEEIPKGLYDFLSLVRTTPARKQGDGTCDVDYLDEMHYEMDNDYCPSPDYDGNFGNKPTFEDNIGGGEEENGWANGGRNANGTNNSTWDNSLVLETEPDGWGGWGNTSSSEKEKPQLDAWSLKPKAETAYKSDDPWSSQGQMENDAGTSWNKSGTPKENERNAYDDPWSSKNAGGNSWDACGGPKEKQPDPWEKELPANTDDPWASVEARKKPKKQNDGDTCWDNLSASKENDPWGNKKSNTNNSEDASWGNFGASKQNEPSNQADPWVNEPSLKDDLWSSNNLTNEPENSNSWADRGKKPFEPRKKRESTPLNDNNNNNNNSLSWDKSDAERETQPSTDWTDDPWSSAKPVQEKTEQDKTDTCGEKKTKPDADPSSWDKRVNVNSGNEEDKTINWGEPWTPTSQIDGWGVNISSRASTPDISSEGWGGPKSKKWARDRGYSGNNTNRGGRPPRNPDGGERRGFGGRRRVVEDLTPEEKEIETQIEPVVQNVRRILREAIEAEKLTEEDQKFVREKILEHHPEKESKVLENIDYLVVDKHKKYQQNRCFYIVMLDGSAEDFSYIKCLENFIKNNFPEHGDSFNQKYFGTRPPEEEKISLEINPIIHNIKRIIRESTDGEKLGEEDEKFIIERVLEHHPDKQSKITDKIDYIRVDKHKKYQQTRCLFVVSSDGSAEDFSYIKCMENYVRTTYPDHAESYCSKYFRKHHKDGPPPTDGSSHPLQQAQAAVTDSWSQPHPDDPSQKSAEEEPKEKSDGWNQKETDGVNSEPDVQLVVDDWS